MSKSMKKVQRFLSFCLLLLAVTAVVPSNGEAVISENGILDIVDIDGGAGNQDIVDIDDVPDGVDEIREESVVIGTLTSDSLRIDMEEEAFVAAAALAAPDNPAATKYYNRKVNGYSGEGILVYNFDEIREVISMPEVGTNIFWDGTSNIMKLYLAYQPDGVYQPSGAGRDEVFVGSGSTIVFPSTAPVRSGYTSGHGGSITKLQILGADPREATTFTMASTRRDLWQTLTWSSNSGACFSIGTNSGHYLALQLGKYVASGTQPLGTRTASGTTMELYNADFTGTRLFYNGGSSSTTTIIDASTMTHKNMGANVAGPMITARQVAFNRWTDGPSEITSTTSGQPIISITDSGSGFTLEKNNLTVNANGSYFIAGTSISTSSAATISAGCNMRMTGTGASGYGLFANGASIRTLTVGNNGSFVIEQPSGTHGAPTTGSAFVQLTTLTIGTGSTVDIAYNGPSTSASNLLTVASTTSSYSLTIASTSTLRLTQNGGTGSALYMSSRTITNNGLIDITYNPSGGTGNGIRVNQTLTQSATGKLYMEHGGTGGDASIAVRSLQMTSAGALLYANRTSTTTAPTIQMVTSTRTINVTQPSRFYVANVNGGTIASDSTTYGTVTINAPILNHTYGGTEYIWHEAGFTSRATAVRVTNTASVSGGFSSAYSSIVQPEQYPVNYGNLNLANASSSKLAAGPYVTTSVNAPLRGNGNRTVTGSSLADFVMGMEYDMTNDTTIGSLINTSPWVAAGGSYTLTMNNPLHSQRKAVYALADKEGLRFYVRTTSVGQVWITIEENLLFEQTGVVFTNEIINRLDPDWEVVVHDTHGYYNNSTWVSSGWNLTVRVNDVFKNAGGTKTLPNSRLGLKSIPTSSMTLLNPGTTVPVQSVASMPAGTEEYTKTWPSDAGFFFNQVAGEGEADVEYSVTMIWELITV